MSLLSILKTIWEALTGKQKKIANVSYDIIEAIKKIDASHSSPLEIVLAVIPEKLHEKFSENIVSILFNCRLIDNMAYSADQAIILAADRIKNIKGSLNHKVSLNSLGIFLSSVLADGKIGWNDLVHLPKLIFDNKTGAQTMSGDDQLSGVDTDGDGIDDWEDDDADGDGISYLSDPNDPRHGRP